MENKKNLGNPRVVRISQDISYYEHKGALRAPALDPKTSAYADALGAQIRRAERAEDETIGARLCGNTPTGRVCEVSGMQP